MCIALKVCTSSSSNTIHIHIIYSHSSTFSLPSSIFILHTSIMLVSTIHHRAASPAAIITDTSIATSVLAAAGYADLSCRVHPVSLVAVEGQYIWESLLLALHLCPAQWPALLPLQPLFWTLCHTSITFGSAGSNDLNTFHNSHLWRYYWSAEHSWSWQSP